MLTGGDIRCGFCGEIFVGAYSQILYMEHLCDRHKEKYQAQIQPEKIPCKFYSEPYDHKGFHWTDGWFF